MKMSDKIIIGDIIFGENISIQGPSLQMFSSMQFQFCLSFEQMDSFL